MKFDLDEFTQDIYEEYKDELSYDQVEDLLDIKAQYDLDTPISTGKKLVINRIAFYGEKHTEDTFSYSGDTISYSAELNTGINIWIADNLKGKSSIFKIIKYALTGSNKLKNNIDEWVSDIILNINIGEKYFTIYLNNNGRLSAKLIIGTVKDLEEIESGDYKTQFEASSKTEYQDKIQEFFFKQFSYYSLKWTQKASRKDQNKLYESSASWKTYFKSIFLESKDSNSLMYGSQGEKIFQMLLGLEFTFPINRLNIKKDKLEFDKAKFNDKEHDNGSDEREALVKELGDINEKIKELESSEEKSNNISDYYVKYDALITKLDERNEEALKFENKIQDTQEKLESLASKKSKYKKEFEKLKSQISNTRKRINDLNEYLEIDAFFSNIEIKKCPSCDSEVRHTEQTGSEESVTCSLCHEEYDKNEREFDRELFEQKIRTLVEDKEKFENKRTEFEDEVISLEEREKELNKELKELKLSKENLPSSSSIQNQLAEVEKNIQKQKSSKENQDLRDDLISKRAIIKHEIEQLQEQDVSQNKYDVKISLLSTAIEKLSKIRFERGAEILNRLKDLMLDEIHEFGLTSITEISISNNFQIKFKQDGEFISFNEIVEGEQLRAKIAFYLSLIQLDIEYNFGRHTRFLIIDSPGKEEGDENYLEGFASVLNSIEDRFSKDLQILIGTAERKLEHTVENEKVTPKGEFVF